MPDSAFAQEAGLPASSPHFLVLGRIQRPHGVRGELRLQIVTDYPERIADLDMVYIGRDPYDPASASGFRVAGTRRHREQLLVQLEGIDTREEADRYRDQLLMVSLEDAVPLEEDEYYIFQIIGAEVLTTDGVSLGTIREVLETGANDVFVVQGGVYGEVLLPDIPTVILEIDLDNHRMMVEIPPGLLPE